MFKVIKDVDEAWALLDADLLWWDKREPARPVWKTRVVCRPGVCRSFEESVNDGVFSILLED